MTKLSVFKSEIQSHLANDTVTMAALFAYVTIICLCRYFGTAMQPYWATMNKTTHMLTYATVLYDSFRAVSVCA